MKIDYMSDLHLEFSPFQSGLKGGGDVLVLAGDIFRARSLDPSKTDKQSRRERTNIMDFMIETVKNYKDVIYVTGNHEYYGSDFETCHELLKQHLPKRWRWLNNSVTTVGTVKFVGGTLWTNFANSDPIAMLHAQHGMNDYRYICYPGKESRLLVPQDTVKMHNECVAVIKREAEKNLPRYPNNPIVVVTHTAPSYDAQNDSYTEDVLRDAFCSDLHEVVESNTNIVNWICGHTHVQKSFDIGQCRVLMNCRGYHPNERISKQFKTTPSLTLEGY